MTRIWEYLTWGPFYFVRRLICRVRGHRDAVDYCCEVDFRGKWYCARCMEGA